MTIRTDHIIFKISAAPEPLFLCDIYLEYFEFISKMHIVIVDHAYYHITSSIPFTSLLKSVIFLQKFSLYILQ